MSDTTGYRPTSVRAQSGDDRFVVMSAIRQQVRVLGALILRDARTRFGGSYASYAISVAWPLAHFGLLLGIYFFLGRQASFGRDLGTWILSGVLGFISFMYPLRNLTRAIDMNKALMTFPVVKSIDIIIARIAVETVTTTLVAMVTVTAFKIFDPSFQIAHPLYFICGLFSAHCLGVAVGTFGCGLSRINTMIGLALILFSLLLWVTAGVFFLIQSIPEPYHYYATFNPLLHCLEIIRLGLYSDYPPDSLNVEYLVRVISILFLLGLLLDRFLPKLMPQFR